jgi:aquaporin Z
LWQKSQISLLKDKLFNNKGRKVFFAELIGTFIVVTLATGSVVIDAKLNGVLGLPFIAIAPAIAVAVGVYLFGKISMAHFNPAVTVGFLLTGHIKRYQLINYFMAEIFGAILASLFVKYFVAGSEANLGANAPNYNYPLSLIFGVEVFASALLMAVICIVVYTKGLRGFSGIVIGGIVGLDIFFLAFISGASMNPARSLTPAIVSGYYLDLWLYLTAPFVGISIIGFIWRKKFQNKLN